MATGGFIHGMEDLLSCQICFEEFSIKTPRQLSCLHVFCEECINSLLPCTEIFEDNVICPVCKVNTDIPEGCAENLPLFFHSRKLEEIKKQFDERYAVCKVCQTKTHKTYITSYCFQCYSGLCDDCRIRHDKRHQKHICIHVTSSTINYIICKDHDSHFEYFCMTCKRAICSKCCIGLHSDHQVYDLTYDGKGVSDEVKSVLVSKLELTNKALKRLDNLQDDATIRTKEIRSEIDKHHDLLIEEVNKQYKSLCVKLDQIQEGIKKDLEISRGQLQETKQRITKLLEQNKSWLEPVEGISEARVVGIDELASSVKDEVSSTDVILTNIPSTGFIAGHQMIDHGHVTVTGVTSTSVCAKPTIVWKRKVEDMRGMDYLSNGDLVVVTDKCVNIYDKHGSEMLHYLSNVCKSDEGNFRDVYVDNRRHRVIILEISNQNRPGYLHVYTSVDNTWEYKRVLVCRKGNYVALNKRGDFIIGGDDSKLYKYNTDGRRSWCVPMTDRANGLFVDCDDLILVSLDSDVTFYQQNGNILKVIAPNRIDISPHGIWVNDFGQIFICDEESESVLIYDKYKDCSQTLIDMESRPVCITLPSERKLATSTNTDDSCDSWLYVYNFD